MGKKSTTRHVNHCLKLISDRGVILYSDLYQDRNPKRNL